MGVFSRIMDAIFSDDDDWEKRKKSSSSSSDSSSERPKRMVWKGHCRVEVDDDDFEDPYHGFGKR